MTRELTRDEICALRDEAKADARCENELWFVLFARAIIKADRALRVPMTEDEMGAAWELSDGRSWVSFEEGIRAAERFHKIKGSE